MLIKNAKVFVGRTFVDADILFEDKILAIGKLEGEADLDAKGGYVIPGLVDIHTHGAVGEDFSDGRAEGMQPMADYYAAHGVTSFLATTMTLKEEVLTPAMHTIGIFGVMAAPSAPVSTWRVPSWALPSVAPRRLKTSMPPMPPSLTGSMRPAAAW